LVADALKARADRAVTGPGRQIGAHNITKEISAMKASKKLIGAGLVLAAIGTVSSGAVNALFTDQDVVPNNTFSTGTLILNTNPTTAVVSYSNMAPGDSVTNPLNIINSGTLDFRYSMTSAITADTNLLKNYLSMQVRSVDLTTPGVPCDQFDGTLLYSGSLEGPVGGLIVGNPATGQQGGATTGGDRLLAAGANENLCIRVTLALSAPNSVQASSTTAQFTFDSEQTKNNP
jgi:spore coat-associated protein N